MRGAPRECKASTAARKVSKNPRVTNAAHKAAATLRDQVKPRPRERVRLIDDDPCEPVGVEAYPRFDIIRDCDRGCAVSRRLACDRQQGDTWRRALSRVFDGDDHARTNLAPLAFAGRVLRSPKEIMIDGLADLRSIGHVAQSEGRCERSAPAIALSVSAGRSQTRSALVARSSRFLRR